LGHQLGSESFGGKEVSGKGALDGKMSTMSSFSTVSA
jgi:hypothetical protein